MMSTCHEYEKYSLGEIDAAAFEAHAGSCEICRQMAEADARLMAVSRKLKTSVDAPDLWNRIEEILTAESRPSSELYRKDTFKIIYRIAAVVVIAAGLAGYLANRNNPVPDLLNESALSQVECREKAYVESIARLETEAADKMQDMHIELSLLYRDRLELIDAQIRRCEEALDANPANTHIRRYLLAALQDKKETLIEILHTENKTT